VTLYQLSSSYKLATSQPVVIITHIDTGSHNKLDLLQSLVPTHCCYHDSYWYWFTQQAWPATKSCTNTLLLSWLILILGHTTSLTCYKVLYQHTVAIMTDIDTSSHNKLDLLQSLVPTHCCYHDWYWYWFTQQAWPATKSCTNTLSLSLLILILVHTTSLTCYTVLYQHTVAIMTHIDTSSHNKLDLIQSHVPIHYVYNWYVFQWFQATVSNYFLVSI
jgi:hypothetical protein